MAEFKGEKESPSRGRGMLRTLGLGLITGAADDDPSAIGTYASAGAAVGPAFLWTAPVTFPMMCAVVKTGHTEVNTAAEAAEALRPLAGEWATILFALGVIGVGFLAVPVMTTGAAYDLCQVVGWKHSLHAKPREAKRFYAAIAGFTLLAMGMNFLGFNPMKALVFSGIVQGFSTPPLLLLIMLITNNRVTFMVVAEDEVGRVEVRHYMLPVGKLIDSFDYVVKERIQSNPLNLVRYMSVVQNHFARKRSLQPEENTDEANVWRELVYGKWVDPVMSLIAAYFFIRLGAAGPEAEPQDKWLLGEVIKNLRNYFGDLPDVAVLERAMGKSTAVPTASPIIRDGAWALDAPKVLALPENQLDYNSSWTSWRDAVNAYKPKAASGSA